MIEHLKINVLDSSHITNCYIIWDSDTKEAVIVDPADKVDMIQEKIRELGLKVKYIALTHAHKDHTIALDEIRRIYNVNIIANIQEKDMLQGKIDDCSKVFGLVQNINDLSNFIFLEDKDKFSVGNTEIVMLHTPGHTKGSACYYIEKENILITGDTLFSDCFGRCDLASASIDDMVKSLIKLYKNYNNAYIYPGHGDIKMLVSDTYNSVNRILLNIASINLDNLIK